MKIPLRGGALVLIAALLTLIGWIDSQFEWLIYPGVWTAHFLFGVSALSWGSGFIAACSVLNTVIYSALAIGGGILLRRARR